MIRGIHVLALAAIALAALSVRATESYTTRYQSLPVQDWLESRPPLAESAALPAATDLVRGLARTMPLLTIRDDARPRLPAFGPPAYVQRTMGGVRDAARIELASPGQFAIDAVPVRARLDVIVFNRRGRATAWSELMAREMDIKDPESGAAQARTAGPDERDDVWVIAPRSGGGVATVSGRRGAVGFVLQVTYLRTSDAPADLVDLSARAETTARQAAADYAGWLTQQLPA
ncbi:MAG TPA: hypothetical protein VGQ62_06940 [Chloroflexota bacterium]|nr:hypothetical protein [Chloroflexota bacterium]